MRIWLDKTVDEEFEDLGTAGHLGALNDRQYSLLGALGYTGALADRMGAFIAAGRPVGDITAPILSANTFNDGLDTGTVTTTEGGTLVMATHLITENVSANGSGGWTGNTLETATDTVAGAGSTPVGFTYTATTGTGGEDRKFSYYIRDAAGNDSNVVTETFVVNSASYSANAVDLTGVFYGNNNSYAPISAGQTGTFQFSFYWPSDTGITTSGKIVRFMNAGGNQGQVELQMSGSTGKVEFYLRNEATLVARMQSSTVLSTDTWYTLTVSWDLATNDGGGDGTFHGYFGDSLETWNELTPPTLGETVGSIGRIFFPTNSLTGSSNMWVSNLFCDTVYRDLTNTTTRRQFVDASGKPADVSLVGTPHALFTNAYTSFTTNNGTAGNMGGSVGDLAAAGSSPTD